MSSSGHQRFKTWNQKFHIYLGLYFLVFLWLFAVSGLLLNHAWGFTDFWSKRQQSTSDHPIAPPQASDDLGRARDLMRQLNLAGELEWTTTQATPGRFDFRVARPGRTVEVKADFTKGTATLQEIRVNGWGVFRTLHTFTGVRANDPRAERDWSLTKLWSLSMDALAVGLIALVATSAVMAYQRREKWLGSSIALALGLVVCGFFVFGLRWM
ncbi:MAG: hypothetical protein HZA93_08480 [Verrucomicrobia bacterium]|nr:hypothetical protein [Verrucomicrobiota bacterium]